MKKCPSCEKTFEDSMRFCQVDGTPLVDSAPATETAEAAFDPYATIVGQAPPAEAAAETPAADEAVHHTVGSVPIAPPEDMLELPLNDPLKTMYVSDEEMKGVLGDGPNDVVDLPPAAPEPPPPSFIAPEPAAAEPEAPSFGDLAAPPSPFSAPEPEPEAKFDEAATIIQAEPQSGFADGGGGMPSPFDAPPPSPMAAWEPSAPPTPMWQEQEVAAPPAFGSPASVGGPSQGLAIAAMVCGILSCLCCVSVFTGPAGFIMGYIAKNKAEDDPQNYGGRSFALAGMVTGAIGFLLGIVLIVLQIFFGVLGSVAG